MAKPLSWHAVLLSLENGFLFIAAGRTGTTSISAALLPHVTTDRERLPFSVRLNVPTEPETEALVNDDSRPLGDERLVQAVLRLHVTRTPFEITLQNKETGFARKSADLDDMRHVPARAARCLVGEAIWARVLKFAFVRDPWDWVLSNYAFKTRQKVIDRIDTEHVRWVRDNVSRRQLPIDYRTQHAFVCDDDGRLGLDFVGRFERLAGDFAEVARRLELALALRHLNEFLARRHSDLRTLYSVEAFDLVGELWAQDVESFGYDRRG